MTGCARRHSGELHSKRTPHTRTRKPPAAAEVHTHTRAHTHITHTHTQATRCWRGPHTHTHTHERSTHTHTCKPPAAEKVHLHTHIYTHTSHPTQERSLFYISRGQPNFHIRRERSFDWAVLSQIPRQVSWREVGWREVLEGHTIATTNGFLQDTTQFRSHRLGGAESELFVQSCVR